MKKKIIEIIGIIISIIIIFQNIAYATSSKSSLQNQQSDIDNQIKELENEQKEIKANKSETMKSVEDLIYQISDVENEITDIKQSISNINNSITQIQADMTSLEARVKKLEDLLKNLNIIPPIDIYNATDEEFKTGLWQNWWNWFKPKLYFPVADIANGWEYSSNVVWWDTTTRLPHYFQLGRVTQPITLCKLPFVAVRKDTFDHEPTIEDLREISPRFNNNAFTAGNGFFDFPLTSPFGFTMDEIKFQTSYIPFLPINSILYYSSTTGVIAVIKNINCGVRLQVPITGTSAKLSVASDILIMGACPNSVPITDNTKWDMYIYAVAENG